LGEQNPALNKKKDGRARDQKGERVAGEKRKEAVFPVQEGRRFRLPAQKGESPGTGGKGRSQRWRPTPLLGKTHLSRGGEALPSVGRGSYNGLGGPLRTKYGRSVNSERKFPSLSKGE